MMMSTERVHCIAHPLMESNFFDVMAIVNYVDSKDPPIVW